MIIYQLALRTFTPDGTLKATKALLPHIASLGVDIVYLCPFYAAENDEDQATWSKRQKASNTGNPKNPYKMSDYFNVDSEYGTNQDLKDFVDTAHKNHLLVMFDLVYLHCGKSAVFVEEHPDFVIRNEDGSVMVGENWPFARLNFKSEGLRKYLLKNMETLLTEYKADCFRCDVGDAVPLDFWKDSFEYLKQIKPELITLNEGTSPEYIENVFDMGYDFDWNKIIVNIFAHTQPATELKKRYLVEEQMYGDDITKLIRTIDTHDTASDIGLDRNEITMTSRGVEAALVITNTFDGIPFIWNGYEICDNAENNMFSNRFYGRRSAMNWSRAFTAEGIRRMEFIKKVHAVYHGQDALINGKLSWVDNSEEENVISYVKKSDNQQLLILVNTRNTCTEVALTLDKKPGEVILSSGAEMSDNKYKLAPYGYCIFELV